MNRQYPKLLFLSMLLLLACKKDRQLDGDTVAFVGDKAIDFADYKLRYQDYLDASQMKDNLHSRHAVLNNMINEILLYDFDDNTDIYNSREFNKELAWAKNQMILGYLKDREIYSKIEVTDEEVRRAFVRVNEKIAARHLYAETEEQANALYKAVSEGATFEKLASQVFTDSVLKSNGGYLGYFTWGDMDPGFEDAVYQMKPGDISQPVKTSQGYSVIKVEDRIRQPILTEAEYAKKKPQITRLLKISRKKEYEQKFVKRIIDEDKIEFNDQSLGLLFKIIKKVRLSENEQGVNKKEQICVSYDSDIYSIFKIEQMIQKIPVFHLDKIKSADDVKKVIIGLIVQEALLEYASGRNYEDEPKVIQAIHNSRNNLFLKYKRREITSRQTFPDTSLEKYYSENTTLFNLPREINVKEIIVENQNLALKLKGQLLSGADFSEVARQYSMRSWSAQNGGEIGYAALDRFGSLKSKLWDAEIGTIIGPVEIDGLFGLFTVLDKIDNRPAPFKNIRDQVEQSYKDNNQTQIVSDYLKTLRSDVTIKKNTNLIKSFILQGESS